MNAFLKLTTATLFALSLLPLASPAFSASPARQSEIERGFAEFSLKNETFLDALWKISNSPHPIEIGFEKVLKEKLSDPDTPEPRFTIDLKNVSIREILNTLCTLDPRYTWWADSGLPDVVNIFPVSMAADSSYLLNRRPEKLELRKATEVEQSLFATANQLPAPFEQVAVAQIGGDPYPPEPWSFAATNVTVREVINTLALHSGGQALWIFSGAKDFGAFGFFNTRPSPWLGKPSSLPPWHEFK